MDYQFDIFNHHVFQPEIIPKSRHVSPDSITVKLTIEVSLFSMRHDSLLTNLSFSRKTLGFHLNILKNESPLHQLLAHELGMLRINTASVGFHNLIREIIGRGLGMTDRVLKRRSDERKVLPLRAVVHALERDDYPDADSTLTTTSGLAEFERTDFGMVPAKESLVEEMLKKVRVESGEEEKNCIVCLEKLKVGTDASRMPCSHTFHADCIQEWLKRSHYCPICRYEMPTTDQTNEIA